MITNQRLILLFIGMISIGLMMSLGAPTTLAQSFGQGTYGGGVYSVGTTPAPSVSPTPIPTPSPTPKSWLDHLPGTGASLGLTGAAGLLLVGAGLTIRRRKRIQHDGAR